MAPGGTTEIIWHFAGYLHLAIDDVRARLTYEDGALTLRQGDYVATLPDFDFPADLAPFDTDRTRPPDFPFEDTIANGRTMPAPLAAKLPAVKVKVPTSDEIEKVASHPPTGSGAAKAMITVTYGEGGEQIQVEVDQINMASDDDQFGVLPGSDAGALHQIDIAATIESLAQSAADEVPPALALPQSGVAEVAAFVASQHAATKSAAAAADGEEDASPPVKPGLYINGELQPAGTVRTETPETEEPAPNLAAKGQWATLGDNIAENAAVIVDINDAAPTLVVLGDYFATNAIVQVNAFVDNDKMDLGAALPTQVITGGNTADNIAEFIDNGGVHGARAGLFGGPLWHVDVVDGDFFDVTLLTQKNYLQDNDITGQTGQVAHYQVVAGANEQYNLAELLKGETPYDAIIIGGDYHGENFIFQTNVLLDSDILKMVAGGDEPTAQFALTGENALLNDATIVTYGNDSFQQVGPGLRDLATALANRDGTIDMAYGNLLPGNGTGVLNVLYITGDYYDINALWQVNVIADADLALQLLSGAPVGQGELILSGAPAGEGGLTQSASTGGNTLTNSAAIIDVGSTFSYLGGEMYDDSILIQANLVTDDEDAVVNRNTDALVSEIIAFTGPDEADQNDDTHPLPTLNPQDDVMGSVLT